MCRWIFPAPISSAGLSTAHFLCITKEEQQVEIEQIQKPSIKVLLATSTSDMERTVNQKTTDKKNVDQQVMATAATE